MPVSRLQYNWDNNYTKKEKCMILLTQETIDKINNITTGWIDAVVETRTHTPYQTMTFAQLAALNDGELIKEELNKAPIDYYNSLIDEERLRDESGFVYIYDNWSRRLIWEKYFVFTSSSRFRGSPK